MNDNQPFVSAERRGPRLARAPRIVLLIAAELVLFAVIGCSFWYQDLRYSLPTPKPAGWKAPPMGSSAQALGLTVLPEGRPAVFNFYSCDCPCSRFNFDHVRRLIKSFGSRIRFVMVIEGGTRAEEESVFRGLGVETDHQCDFDGRIARELGVYSTPQAAVLDAKQRLVYRGNYNIGRFCIDPRTEFVRLALESVVSGRPLPTGMERAGPAYGCAISAVSTMERDVKS